MNRLYYGDNLEVLRCKVATESVDLCYIDPPFHSRRNYHLTWDRAAEEERARSQAFTDTWQWDEPAAIGCAEILANAEGRFSPQLAALMKGLREVLGEGGLMAYLVSKSLRATEIFRVLKQTGSFYLHCDPTASHYLKIVLDAVFCSQGGEFQNEIVWSYQTGGASKKRYARKHDVILFYTKSDRYTFRPEAIREPRTEGALKRAQSAAGARICITDRDKLPTDVFQIAALNPMAVERLGYPTQKPEALLERIINASSEEGDVVLDAYCGGGTTVAVAQRLQRRWIGIDNSRPSIVLSLRRLEKAFGAEVVRGILQGADAGSLRECQE